MTLYEAVFGLAETRSPSRSIERRERELNVLQQRLAQKKEAANTPAKTAARRATWKGQALREAGKAARAAKFGIPREPKWTPPPNIETGVVGEAIAALRSRKAVFGFTEGSANLSRQIKVLRSINKKLPKGAGASDEMMAHARKAGSAQIRQREREHDTPAGQVTRRTTHQSRRGVKTKGKDTDFPGMYSGDWAKLRSSMTKGRLSQGK